VSDAILSQAREGDEQAFQEITTPYRYELHVHCYRLLGSLHDAEDALQETLLAAWRGLEGFRQEATLRAWLYRIATNQCLNLRRARHRRPLLAPVPPFDPPEPTRYSDVTWLQPYPTALPAPAVPGPEVEQERIEGIELAFITALQRMPARQAAVLVLRDVLDFPASDVAGMLGVSPTSVKGLLQRARAASGPATDRVAAGSGVPARADTSTPAGAGLARQFADAFAADDVDGVVALLTDDAWLSMPPAPHEYQGRAAIASFLRASAAWRAGRRFRLQPTRANSQPAFGCYLERDVQGGTAQPAGLIVLSVRPGQITRITRFLDASLPWLFALPPALP
jgi:RNA polymerase sigma-70 factor (TIGR02960 family)